LRAPLLSQQTLGGVKEICSIGARQLQEDEDWRATLRVLAGAAGAFTETDTSIFSAFVQQRTKPAPLTSGAGAVFYRMYSSAYLSNYLGKKMMRRYEVHEGHEVLTSGIWWEEGMGIP
jgi:hypothetical protein